MQKGRTRCGGSGPGGPPDLKEGGHETIDFCGRHRSGRNRGTDRSRDNPHTVGELQVQLRQRLRPQGPVAALHRPHHHRTELRHRRGDRPERPQPEGLHPGGGQPKHRGRRSPGRLSGKQPHDTAQLHTCHLRSSWGRTPSCAAPATARSTPPLGANGYVGAFTNSSDSGYQFTSLCLDPGTANIVIVGQEMTSGGPVGIVERLIPPASGSGTANLDTSFNPSGPTPGIVTIATPDGNNSPTLYGCSVVDEGAGHSGAILVGAWTTPCRPAWCWWARSAAPAPSTPSSAPRGSSNTRWTASTVPARRRKSPTSASAAPTPTTRGATAALPLISTSCTELPAPLPPRLSTTP